MFTQYRGLKIQLLIWENSRAGASVSIMQVLAILHIQYGAESICIENDAEHLTWMRKRMMSIDNSWENAVQQYLNLYSSLNKFIRSIIVKLN
jgi:glycogen synthase